MVQQTKDCLSKIHDILQCKVLWIPGNHDPVSFLNGEQHGDEEIINIHKKEYVLDSGLTILGLGGSLPAYTDQQSKSQEWCGYPYKCEEEYSRDLELVFKEDEIKSSKIFFTHVGPSASNTTVDRRR
jgi:Icc-related predicted phosphoesterase